MIKFFKTLLKKMRGEVPTSELVKLGMKVGYNFNRQSGVILDRSHCFLIEIGNDVTIAPRTIVLAHDASTKNYLGYTKIGKVVIGNNVFIGAGSVILPKVSIGNNVIIGAHSTITNDIPENSVVIGSPARVISSVTEYIEKEKKEMNVSPVFGEEYTIHSKSFSKEKVEEMSTKLKGTKGYII